LVWHGSDDDDLLDRMSRIDRIWIFIFRADVYPEHRVILSKTSVKAKN
jgi:hypothetical protein